MAKNIKDEIIIYKSQDGNARISVTMVDNTLWLNQAQIAELYDKDISGVSRHISNIFSSGELDENSNLHFLQIPNSSKPVAFYSLDVIIAVGYRVKSNVGLLFRQWATAILHEYMQKGFALNDEKLKEFGGGDYFKELLERIRDIRSSEKAMYRQVLELYSTSLDYDAKNPITYEFFKIVQNKMHYATTKKTAAEIIFERANSELPFMGLTTFKGKRPIKKEVDRAKNYMNEDELFVLNRIVSAFFEIAELKATQREPMYMADWLAELDKFTNTYGEGVLKDSGSISNEKALTKAFDEYKKYKEKQNDELTEVEKDYLNTLKEMQKRLKANGGKYE